MGYTVACRALGVSQSWVYKAGRAGLGYGAAGFHRSRAELTWCGDLTEIPTDEGLLHLAGVEDVFLRTCRPRGGPGSMIADSTISGKVHGVVRQLRHAVVR